MRRIPIVLVCAAAIAVAGCGGGGGGKTSGPPLTKAEYQAKLQQIAKDIGTKIQATSSDIDKLTDKDLQTAVQALESFADEMAKVNPPTEIAQLHDRLVSGVRDFADEFPGIVDKLKNTKDPSAAITALFGAKSIQELAKLQEELKAKGYDLNLSS